MQHPLIDEIFEKLHSYDSVFNEILDQAEKEKNESKMRIPYLEMLELEENENNELNESVRHEQVDERSKPTSGDEECVDEDQVHDVPFVEERITNELRKCCNLFGIEIPEKLRLSAKHFLELGKVYLDYAVTGDWGQRFAKDSKREVQNKKPRKLFRESKTQQNLNFVKGAALMVGAIVRFEIMKEPEYIQIATSELCRLHRHIMKIDHMKGHRNVDILTFTEEIKRTLELYRQKIAVELETIAQLQEENRADFAQDDAGMRDSKMSNICEQYTVYYLDIMAKVAEKCESIMGKPPCKNSIIGLRSLTRKEVTLYSDFEHAILLEDGLGDYTEATEYFRWFSTIFTVIIIGLGETVIPSIGVRSLNDFNSSDERKNWFRDEYTPCGVSFDGMMPHACKNPLGRQEPTKYRSHTVERIQPVSKMVNLLTKEEEDQNGYFLSDIFSKVGLVFGSQESYDVYLPKACDLLERRTQEEMAETIAQLQQENREDFAQDDAGMRDSKVRNICEQCTEFYLDIMARVAEKCESIMGKPPCKFFIIGLGSLARKKVTLYSDYEHAILLGDELGDYTEAPCKSFALKGQFSEHTFRKVGRFLSELGADYLNFNQCELTKQKSKVFCNNLEKGESRKEEREEKLSKLCFFGRYVMTPEVHKDRNKGREGSLTLVGLAGLTAIKMDSLKSGIRRNKVKLAKLYIVGEGGIKPCTYRRFASTVEKTHVQTLVLDGNEMIDEKFGEFSEGADAGNVKIEDAEKYRLEDNLKRMTVAARNDIESLANNGQKATQNKKSDAICEKPTEIIERIEEYQNSTGTDWQIVGDCKQTHHTNKVRNWLYAGDLLHRTALLRGNFDLEKMKKIICYRIAKLHGKNWTAYVTNVMGVQAGKLRLIKSIAGSPSKRFKTETLKYWRQKNESTANGFELAKIIMDFKGWHGEPRFENIPFKKICQGAIEMIDDDSWLQFVRLQLKLSENEIKKLRIKYSGFTQEQKYQIVRRWMMREEKIHGKSDGMSKD